jgi:UDP-glucuronate decarboxylase
MMSLMSCTNDIIGLINIGNPREFTMIELANLVIELTNSNSEIIFLPLPQDDPMQRKPILELAKSKLNWEPKISLKDGLVKTIKYFDLYV